MKVSGLIRVILVFVVYIASGLEGYGDTLKVINRNILSNHYPIVAEINNKVRYPVKVEVEVVPDDLQEWNDIINSLVRDYYDILGHLLLSEDCKAPETVKVTVRDYKGVAGTAGNHITINADWLRKHPDDLGMVIHELAHVVQSYPKYDPVWLIEALADYCRFWVYEPEESRPRIDPLRTNVRDSYQRGAAFMAWLVKQYGDKFIREISTALRKGTYSEELFEKITGESLETLHMRYRHGKKKKL